MAFVLNPDCIVDFWLGVGAPPWETGDPPTVVGIEAQKIKSWLGVSPSQFDTSLADGNIGIARFLWAETPQVTSEWTYLSGLLSYIALRTESYLHFFNVLAVDMWLGGGSTVPVVNMCWCNLVHSELL